MALFDPDRLGQFSRNVQSPVHSSSSYLRAFPFVLCLSDGQDQGFAGSRLVQPRSPEFPLGVLTFTLAVPGAEITAVVIVACNCWLLVARVLSLEHFHS